MRRALAILFVFGVLLSACGREDDVALPSPSRFPTASPTAQPTDESTSAPEASDEPTSSPDGTATPEPTPVDPCRNSRDEKCGKFHYDPEPENGKLTLSVSYTPKDPKAGDVVTFTVVAKDDGGTPSQKLIIWGNGETTSSQVDCEQQARPYGPWDAPDPDPQDNTDVITHTYDNPGNFEAQFVYSTKRCDYYGYNPYGSEGRTKVAVDVAPNITPRPSS